jgi:hypothetical protein
LGKLLAEGHGIAGYCTACQRPFSIDMTEFIRQRGADQPIIGMRPLVCPSCGGRRTQFRVTVLPKGDR